MRGSKTLAERGVIPRLLSGIYRRARKIDKDSGGKRTVEITLSYYEIYNDKVYDLFEAPEKRTLAGLPLRDNGSKTVVIGLTERPCETLKEFEKLYEQANVNRSTSATKVRRTILIFSYDMLRFLQLNASSSRSHAILGIKLAVATGEEVRTSIASAIDLAGSEDNRRTQNGKERMVESASINKSLFTLAKCVEAISQKDARVPYRESKMTRILSLGQNNGLTIMILNLAPVRSFHLDTLSSLNFANRTKRIEVREIENEPVFKLPPRAAVPSISGSSIQRQPLRPLASTVHNASAIHAPNNPLKQNDKQIKAFSVYSDRARHSNMETRPSQGDPGRRSSPLKRPAPSDTFMTSASRPAKRRSPNRITSRIQPTISKAAIEDMIERKVTDILAARALDQPSVAPQPEISDEVQRRLDLLEKKIDVQDDGREQGLTFLLMAKQHAVRGEDASALRMYNLAKDFFPDNKKLGMKIEKLREKIQQNKEEERRKEAATDPQSSKTLLLTTTRKGGGRKDERDDDYQDEVFTDQHYESDGGFHYKPKIKNKRATADGLSSTEVGMGDVETPRTRQLLDIVNSRDIRQIRLLKGVGAKKAEAIIEALCTGEEDEDEVRTVTNLRELGQLRGVGAKTVENMRLGLQNSMDAVSE